MFGEGNPHRIVVLDCGIKHNMIRNLVKVCLHLSVNLKQQHESQCPTTNRHPLGLT